MPMGTGGEWIQQVEVVAGGPGGGAGTSDTTEATQLLVKTAVQSINNKTPALLGGAVPVNATARACLGQETIALTAAGTASLTVPVAVPTSGGTFGNFPLYIGRRAGASLPFNGRIYSLLLRGAFTPVATISAVEKAINREARVF